MVAFPFYEDQVVTRLAQHRETPLNCPASVGSVYMGPRCGSENDVDGIVPCDRSRQPRLVPQDGVQSMTNWVGPLLAFSAYARCIIYSDKYELLESG